jgi:hypothetical protein
MSRDFFKRKKVPSSILHVAPFGNFYLPLEYFFLYGGILLMEGTGTSSQQLKNIYPALTGSKF